MSDKADASSNEIKLLADAFNRFASAMEKQYHDLTERYEKIAHLVPDFRAITARIEHFYSNVEAQHIKLEKAYTEIIDTIKSSCEVHEHIHWKKYPEAEARQDAAENCSRTSWKDSHSYNPWWQREGYYWQEEAKKKTVNVREARREEVGLKLLGGPLESDGKTGMMTSRGAWEYHIIDEHRRSFAGLLKNAIVEDARQALFDQIRYGVDWGEEEAPRQTVWMVAPPCQCTYSFSGNTMTPHVWPDWMHKVLSEVMPLCGITSESEWPNSCFLNLYESGGGGVGWHADDEPLFQGLTKDCAIVSLSLGQGRLFEMYADAPSATSEPVRCSLRLESGDICTMEGMFQKHYWHSAPQEEEAELPRINLTWRWVVEHVLECPMSLSEIATSAT